MAIPYKLPQEAATTIAQICCHSNSLPQGAPTSPTIANMICARMDTRLRRLAEKYRCYYTRYADDITFSTNAKTFPAAIATTNEEVSGARVGFELDKAITENGFSINNKKIRLQSSLQRQEVTGLTVNEFPNVNRRYIRKIRAILYNWDTHGKEHAQRQLDTNYCSNSEVECAPPIEKVVRGRIEFVGMIRGKQDSVYWELFIKLNKLAPETVNENKLKAWTDTQNASEGEQIKKCTSALSDAFRTPEKLEQLVTYHLDDRLSEISIHKNMADMIYELIMWARSHGKFEELIKGAISENPGNPQLKKFVTQYFPDISSV